MWLNCVHYYLRKNISVSKYPGLILYAEHKVIQEEMLVFWEVIVLVIVRKKSLYEQVSNPEWLPR